MVEIPLPPERDRLYRLVRQGLPLLLAVSTLTWTLFGSAHKAWVLFATVVILAEVAPSFQTGRAYLHNRRSQARRDGLWALFLRPLFRMLGREEAWILSYCAWNNRRVRSLYQRTRARRALVLLPHCIQLAQCKAEVTTRLDACYACGRCTVQDVLEASLAHRWDVRLTNRSHKAYREARAFEPDLMLAVCCYDRLMKGLLKLPEIPAYVIPLSLPHGMCVDTTFDVAHLTAAMSALVEPRTQAVIEPLMSRGSAS